MFKKRSVRFVFSTLSLALCTISAHATYKNMPSNLSVTVPDLRPGFTFNIGATFLKPGASNLNYVIYNLASAPVQSPTWKERELQPSFTPGFQLGGDYIFANRGQDISLDWTHLNTSTVGSTVAPSAAYFLGPDYDIGPPALPITNATGQAIFRYDVVNLDAGQYIQFGNNMRFRIFGGLSTGFLREEVTAIFSGLTPLPFAGPFTVKQDVVSNFSGIGPQFGMQADYAINDEFGILGEADAAALVGVSYAKTSFTSSAKELLTVFGQAVNNQVIQDQAVYQVIPGFNTKLGITYKHSFYKQALATISLGYQAAVYVNAISQYLPGALVTGGIPMTTSLTSGGIFVQTMSHTLSNYSVQGPFLNLAISC